MPSRNKFITVDDVCLNTSDIFNFKSNIDYNKKIKLLFCKRYNKKNMIFTKNARSAIKKTLIDMKLSPVDEVIISAYNSKPVLTAVREICQPVFVDIEKNSYTIDIQNLVNKISKKTKAIITTNLYGQSEKMDDICRIAQKNNITIIEDLAQTPWGKYNGKNLGSFGDYTILSFAFFKDLTCFSGGALLSNFLLDNNKKKIHWSNNPKVIGEYYIYRICEKLNFFNYFRNNIFPEIFWKVVSLSRNRPFSNDKYDMITNFMAYLLDKQIETYDSRIKIRRKNTEYLIDNFSSDIIKNVSNDFRYHTFYRFTIQIKDRDKIIKKGLKNGIFFGKSYDYYLHSYPNSIKASKMNLNIPVHHKLANQDLNKIVDFLNKNTV